MKTLLTFILLLSICFLAIEAKKKRIERCMDLDAPPPVVHKPSHRHLQTLNIPHGFRIKFLPPQNSLVDATQINHMFGVGAFFFKQLLKVTDVSDSTIYDSFYSCGTITPTSQYAITGFSFSEADMVISTEI